MYTNINSSGSSYPRDDSDRYTFDILMYKINGQDNEELIDRRSFIDVAADGVGGGFVFEFSAFRIEDVGMNVRFVVLDNSSYTKSMMKPLALLAWPNGEAVPITLRFGHNIITHVPIAHAQKQQQPSLRRLEFTMRRFKTCVFEFDNFYRKSQIMS